MSPRVPSKRTNWRKSSGSNSACIAYHRLGDFGGLVEAAHAAFAEFWARHGVRHPLGEDFSGAPPKVPDRLEAIERLLTNPQ